jgi:hypothetical protein
VRAGDRSDDGAPLGEFTRSWQASAVAGTTRLERVEVVVTWEDHGPQSFALSALRRK